MSNENSTVKKAIRAAKGKNSRVKTMAIISAENPMGMTADDDYNRDANNELIRQLHIGRYAYYQVEGNYDGLENSIMVYNISLEDTLYLAYRFNQESVIFVDMTNPPEVSYQYWEGYEHNTPLKLQREEHKIVDATDDINYYTKICNSFKFRIPFFEGFEKFNECLSEKSDVYDVDRLISESIDMRYTGKHRYACRGKLYGKI